MGRFLLAETCEVAVHHRLDPVHRLHFLFMNGRVGELCLDEMVVESAVCHGTVETADGPDADGKGLSL